MTDILQRIHLAALDVLAPCGGRQVDQEMLARLKTRIMMTVRSYWEVRYYSVGIY